MAVLGLSPFIAQAQEAGIIPGDILIMLTPDGSAHSVAQDLVTLDGVPTGMRVDNEVSGPMRIWLMKFDHTVVSQQRMLAAVKSHPEVVVAQNDHPVTFRNVPNDPQYGDQWHHDNIDSELAWAISTGGVTATGDTIVVCIIEGANLMHPDLVDNRWLNHAEIPNNGIDDDGNGYVDDHRGWNPAGNDDAVYNGGHGTNVAGMIGATGDNGLGMAGANWDVKMMVVTVGNLSQANVIASYTYPLVMRRRYNESNGAEGAFVVATNASWGIDGGDPDSYPLWCAMYDTLGTEGVLSCGATSNSAVDIDAVGDLPTACASDFMVSVTATNNNDVRTFSGYGATTIDVGAPGANVFTTSGTNGYTSTSGTSFASPLTAGVIALLYSAPCPSLMSIVNSDPMAGALYIREMLFDGVDIVGNLPGNTVTGGRINAGTSMQLIMASCGACPAPYAPVVDIAGADQVEFSWNAFSEGPYTVRYRPVGDEDWVTVDGVDDQNYLITDLEACTAYEFQVGIACDEEEMEFSVPAIYTPVQGVMPEVSVAAFPIICAGDSIALTSSSTFGNVWSTGGTAQSISVTEEGIYTVTVNGPCDVLTSEAIMIQVLAPEPPQAEELVLLEGTGTATLTAEGDSIVWYTVPAGGTPAGTGDSWETPILDTSTSYWCANVLSSDATPSFGGAEELDAIGQYHVNSAYWLLFTANGSFVIRSVKVYANGAGSRPIGLIDVSNGNTTVVQGNFAIPDGESRVELGFTVPGPGQYALRVMSGDPQLWRDGEGSNPSYPYPLGTYGAITSSSVPGANATELYYFFYDWEVEPLSVACESERVEVMVDITVGLQELENGGLVNVHPNPASEHLFINMTGEQIPHRAVVQVLDNTGRLISQHVMEEGRSVIPAHAMAGGLYVYRIVAQDAELARGRFVIAH